jgi:outer membrane protein OmpA-like peptidoglycan-associated protein
MAAAAALCLSLPAAAQQSSSGGDERPDLFELSVFGGGSFFKSVSSGLGTKHANGGAVGFRVTENIWKYVGLEQAFTYSANNLTFERPHAAGQPTYGLGVRIYQWSLNPLFYFTPRGAKVRPFVTAGISSMNYNITDNGEAQGRLPQNAVFGAPYVKDILVPALNYGGGLKWHITDKLGLRFDARGLMSKNPTYGFSSDPVGGVYIPRGDKLHGIQTTVGLTYYIGQKVVPPPPPPPPPPPSLGALVPGRLEVGAGTLCQDRAISVRSLDARDPDGRGITYKWKVNGQPAGSNSPQLSFTPTRAGRHTVELELEAPNNAGHPVRTATPGPLSLDVQPYNKPTISAITANPSTLNYGATSSLSVQTTGSACSTVSTSWSASEGTVSGTGNTATFDSKAVRFEQGGKIQAKTVTVTARVTDDRGASAQSQTSIKVDYIPSSIRFSDVIFSKGSARVNNCGKRVLLEELAPKAADPDYEIVLVGHYDADEAPKTKAQQAKPLDMQRILNVVAVLTGGKGTCANVDPSRIKADWVGTEQVSDFQPGLCGTSTRSATKERRGSMVSTADQNRRVEVWLVPKGTKMPASFKGAEVLPEKELKRLGCPK